MIVDNQSVQSEEKKANDLKLNESIEVESVSLKDSGKDSERS